MIERLRQRVVGWWDGLDDDGRVEANGASLAVALFLLHYAFYATWFIEDAAITFAFARNAAIGDGFVAYAGGERVEGFSNPTWTLALMAFRVIGLDPWLMSKLLGAAFGAAAVAGSVGWARRVLPRGIWSATPALLLAVSPQHVCWAASGLENGILAFFLTFGVVRLLTEVESGGRPWSGLWMAGLAATRPEAPMYVAVAGGLAAVFSLRRGVGPTVRWAAGFALTLGVPLLLWHAWRYSYFAWIFPNTYYAKLAEANKFKPLDWDGRGWTYLRNYALVHGRAFLLPVFLLGAAGPGWRRWVAGGLGVFVVLLTIPGLDWPFELFDVDAWDEPDWLVRVRVGVLAFSVLGVAALGVDSKGDHARVTAWLLSCSVLFFSIYSGGDWMEGWRWISLAIVPMSVLLAAGAHQLSVALTRPRIRATSLVLILGTAVTTDVVQTWIRVGSPVTTPYDVHRRVQYGKAVLARIGVDHGTAMDVDMGAHLWWFGPEFVDMAGLVDVPMGHHRWQREFIGQYVYEERQPDLAHVHGSWASKTRMRSHRGWDRYLEIPAFPTSQWSQHTGNHVRRDLIARPYANEPTLVRFGGKVDLLELAAPAPVVAAQEELVVEVAWRRVGSALEMRAVVFLVGPGGVVVAHELPPAYDWEPFSRFKRAEVYLGRHRVPLPADLPPGSYDLGVVVFGTGRHAAPWAAESRDEGLVTHDPRYAAGEARRARAVRVVSVEEADAALLVARTETSDAATAGDCDGAWRRWRAGRHHRPDAARIDVDAAVAREVAACFARRADAAPTRGDAVAALVAGRRLDPREPTGLDVGARLGSAYDAEGRRLEATGDAAGAYAAYRDAVLADPTRSFSRKAAEHVRDVVLGLRGDEEVEDDGGGPGG